MEVRENTQSHKLLCFLPFGCCLLINPSKSLRELPWDETKCVLPVSMQHSLLYALHAFLSANVFLLFFSKPGILP